MTDIPEDVMKLAREPADEVSLLRDLVKGAARADLAERDLAEMREATETFTVEMPAPSDLGQLRPDAYTEVSEREVATQLGRMLMAHQGAVLRREMPDGSKRFTVKVLLR